MTTDSYRIEKLGTNNYETWSCKIKCLLITKKLWSAVEPDPASGGTKQQLETRVGWMITHVKARVRS